MIRTYCDLCGKLIVNTAFASKFKLRKKMRPWTDQRWEELDVHDKCWEDMRDYVRERRSGDE